jgi:hypothetical protein
MKVEMIATRDYIGLEGHVSVGDPLTVTEHRAKELLDLNVADYAVRAARAPGGAERKPAGPGEQKPVAPGNPSAAAPTGRSTATAPSRTRGAGAASASSAEVLRSPARPQRGAARKSTRRGAGSR